MASAMKTGMVRLAAKSISSVSNFYGLSQDANTEPSEWLEETIPAMTSTWRYLWQYSITYFSNGEKETIPPHIIGVFGDKGEDGYTGAKMRMRVWQEGLEMLAGVNGEEFYDIVWIEGDSNKNLYLCKESHTSSADNNPLVSIAGELGFWEMAQNWGFVATELLLSRKIVADEIDADGIKAVDAEIEGKITAATLALKATSFGGNMNNYTLGYGDGEYILPPINGEFKEIKFFAPQFTRSLIEIVVSINTSSEDSQDDRIMYQDSTSAVTVATSVTLGSNKLYTLSSVPVASGDDYDGEYYWFVSEQNLITL